MTVPDTTTVDAGAATEPRDGAKRRKRKRWTPGVSGRVLISDSFLESSPASSSANGPRI